MEPDNAAELLKVAYWYVRDVKRTAGPPTFEAVHALVTNLADWMTRPGGTSRALKQFQARLEQDPALRQAVAGP